MGKAAAGLAADNSAIFLNPAGLAAVKRLNVLTMSAKLLSDVDYITLAVSNPAAVGTVGFSMLSAGVGGIPVTFINGYGSPESTGNSSSYGSKLFILSYALDGKDVSNSDFMKRLKIGGNVKYYLQDFSSAGASFEGASGSGINFDLGLKWALERWVNLGLMLQNALVSTSGGGFTWNNGSSTEQIPTVLKMGIGLKLWGEDAPYQVQAQELLMDVDTDIYTSVSRPNQWHAGLEWWPVEMLAVRLGVDQADDASSGVWGKKNNLTTGIGLTYAGFAFDYAYHQFGNIEENASHFFSISYVGEEKIDALDRPSRRRSRPTIVTQVLPEPELKTFADVPETFWACRPIEYLATLNIFSGFPDGTFRPEANVSREEMAILLVNAKELPLTRPEKQLFTDVPPGYPSEMYIKAAVDRGYLVGTPSGKFNPRKDLTRAQAVAAVAKFAGLIIPDQISENPFPDVSRKYWAAPEIYAAKVGGLLEYLGGQNFEPDKKVTRAEVAEMISKTKFAQEKIKELLLYRNPQG
jgi:hypothetical protein